MSGSIDAVSWRPGMSRMPGMTALLARNWWAIAIRGVVALIFGVVALVLPFATISGLVFVFAIYMLVDGIFAIVAGLRAAAHHERWALLILEGIVDIIAGAVALVLPGLTVLVLVTLLGAWAVISGVLMTIAGFQLHGTHGKWLLVLSGAISVIWGLLLFVAPIAGAVVLTWWLGAYALIFGVVLLVLAFRLRHRHASPTVSPA